MSYSNYPQTKVSGSKNSHDSNKFITNDIELNIDLDALLNALDLSNPLNIQFDQIFDINRLRENHYLVVR